jgi:hypothetical protein
VRIDAFDPWTEDEATLAAYCANVARTRRGVYPDGFVAPAAYVLNCLRNKSASDRTYTFLAWDGDALLGSAEVSWWEAKDNRHLGWMHYDVPGSRAGQPLLDALLAPVVETMRAAGRTSLTVEAQAGGPVAAYVAARGAQRRSAEQHNVARVGTPSRDVLAGIVAAVPEGYERWGFDGAVPGDLMEPYSRLVHTMNTAPRDDLPMEDVDFSPERLRDWEDSVARRGHAMWTVGARSVDTGELAAFTQLIVAPDWPEVAEQEDTAVAVAHRGHGLGLWVKALNLLRLMDEVPAAQRVSTWNAASNDHMIRVNRALGFVCEHEWETWVLDL